MYSKAVLRSRSRKEPHLLVGADAAPALAPAPTMVYIMGRNSKLHKMEQFITHSVLFSEIEIVQNQMKKIVSTCV
jgi:hypothetical protein